MYAIRLELKTNWRFIFNNKCFFHSLRKGRQVLKRKITVPQIHIYTCFLSLANVYLAVCGLTWTLQPAFSPVRFRLLSMFHTSPTGNRDSSKNMIERTAVALFFCLFHFL